MTALHAGNAPAYAGADATKSPETQIRKPRLARGWINMSEQNLFRGTIEAFSSRKGLLRINGEWLWFDPLLEPYEEMPSIGDTVMYVEEDRLVKWLQKTIPDTPVIVLAGSRPKPTDEDGNARAGRRRKWKQTRILDYDQAPEGS